MGNEAQQTADEIRHQLGESVYESVLRTAGTLKSSPSPGLAETFCARCPVGAHYTVRKSGC